MAPDIMSMLGSRFSPQQFNHLDPNSYTPQETMGSGMRDIGLAQLSQVNPEAARLAQARLEAETRVNAMGPTEGYGWGAMLGAPVGAVLGAGLGYASGAGAPGALGGGALGTLAGGVLGGSLSRQYEVESRRAQSYQAALERLQATRAQV